jgi:DNA-binding GntR family transcriptional regulator
MSSGPVVRVADLRDQVFDALRQRILEGAYQPGEKLTEMQVSRDFGVSRTPAREALVMLTQTGLVRPAGRSFELPLFTEKDILALFEVRLLTEPYAVRKIVHETPPETLRAVCAHMRELLTQTASFKDYVKAHTQFRQCLFDLLSNDKLRQMIGTFNDQVHFVRLMTLVDEHGRQRSSVGNLKLIAAIEVLDAAGSATRMAELIQMAEQLSLRALESLRGAHR